MRAVNISIHDVSIIENGALSVVEGIKPGMYKDLSNEMYHASAGISRSGIMSFRNSPLHYWHDYINTERESREKDTPAIVMGNALHTYVLEYESFKDRFIICDKVDRRTTAGKEYWASLQFVKGSRTIIDIDDYRQVEAMATSVMSHPQSRGVIEGALYESSIYWKDGESGVLCKARPDIMKYNLIGDLKTTDDAHPDAFRYSIRKYGYHVQAAMILDGQKANTLNDTPFGIAKVGHDNFIIIAIEKKPPYACAVYILDEKAISIGREIYKSTLLDYKKCLDENVWPTYETQTISI